MATARSLEHWLERTVDGFAERMFKGALHPSEIGVRLVREADLSVAESPVGPTAANHYLLTVHPSVELPARFERSLESLLEETAAERGWRLEGPATVRIDTDPNLSKAGIGCVTSSRPGPRAPWSRLIPPSGPPIPITNNRILIGRSEEADVRITRSEISRRHALLWREAGRVWIDDLGSSNGTTIDGVRLKKPAMVDPGTVVGFGPVSFTFRPV